MLLLGILKNGFADGCLDLTLYNWRRTLRRWCCLFNCLTTRLVHIEVAQSLDTESCLAAVTRFIARRDYTSTVISDIRTNLVGAANELKAFMNEWDKAKIESDLAQKKIVWKFNPPGAPHFGGIWERLVQSCKKVMIAILDIRSLTDELLSTTMCLAEQTLTAQPLTAVPDDPEDLTTLTSNQFLLGRENTSAPIMPSSERYHDLKKIIQNGLSICRQDPEQVYSRIPSTMEPEIEVVKRTSAKPERRRVSMASRWLCETLWVHTWTNPWDLHWQRWCCEISKSQNGTWRAEPASREVSATIIRWCFGDRKQGRRCWRHLKSATEAIREQKLTFETEKLRIRQNSKMVKSEKFYKLGPKICTTPRFLEGKSRATRVYGTWLGSLLNYSWTQQTLLHQTQKCGY